MPEAYILKETENYTVFYFEDLNFWPLRHKLVMFHHWDYDDSNENTLVKNGLHISYDIEDNGFYLTVEKPAVHEVHVLVEETYGINEFYFPKENEEDDTEYVLDETGLEDIKVPYVFTNVNELFNMDQFSETGHAAICGITRSGKTTLLISMTKRFLRNDAMVLYRDDGGGEFRYLAYQFKNATRVFIPEGPGIRLQIGLPVKVERFDWKHPGTIIEQVYKGDYPFNVIVFDPFANVEFPKMIGKFYYRLLRDMLSFLQRKSYSEKYPLVFALDELNDIAAPRSKGYALSEEAKAFVSLVLRKTGKHNVKILCTTHRLQQLSSDFRSQIDNIFIKRYAGADTWAFLKDNTITFNKWAYIKLWKIITTMPPEHFIYVDRYRRFDRYEFTDIPRPKVEYECLGILGGEGEGRKAVCPKCGFTWTYKGDRDETRCPSCRAYVYFDSE